jgi:hypothetical protein
LKPSESAGDLEKPLDGLELVESFDHAVEIQSHAFVDHDVAKAGKPLELSNQLLRKTVVQGQVPHGFGVVLVPVSSAGGKLPGDVDDELADGEE